MYRSMFGLAVAITLTGLSPDTAEARVPLGGDSHQRGCRQLQDRWDDLVHQAANAPPERQHEIWVQLQQILANWSEIHCDDAFGNIAFRWTPPVCELEDAPGCVGLADLLVDRDRDGIVDLNEVGSVRSAELDDTDQNGICDGSDSGPLESYLNKLDDDDLGVDKHDDRQVVLDRLLALSHPEVLDVTKEGVLVTTMTELQAELGCGAERGESEAVETVCEEADLLNTTLGH